MRGSVELACPSREMSWEASLLELPGVDDSFDCPGCGERRPLGEFARTDRDLETVRNVV